MSAPKKNETKPVEPRRVALTAAQVYMLTRAMSEKDDAMRAHQAAENRVNRIMGDALSDAGVEQNGNPWRIDVGDEMVELVEVVPDGED